MDSPNLSWAYAVPIHQQKLLFGSAKATLLSYTLESLGCSWEDWAEEWIRNGAQYSRLGLNMV